MEELFHQILQFVISQVYKRWVTANEPPTAMSVTVQVSVQ
jgi:hypothetical protein